MISARMAALAGAALALAGCAADPAVRKPVIAPAPAPAAPLAPPPPAASLSPAPILTPAPPVAPTTPPVVVLAPPEASPLVYAAPEPPVYVEAPAALAEEAPPPLYVPAPEPVPVQTYAPAPAPVYVSAPAPAPAPVYDYAPPARRLGEMAPVRDEGARGARAGASSGEPRNNLPPRSGRVYKNADGDLSAPGPWELRQFASMAPPARRSHSYDPGRGLRLAEAARAQLKTNVRYDGSYVKIGYPWGDVPANTGVCTDVLVRAYRQLGIDLQQQVHEDMRAAFLAYPSWEVYGMAEPDPNIDHRRVVNMEAFLERHGESLPPTMNAADYQPGDIVTWRISGTQPHIGVVSSNRDPRSGTPLIIHNIGAGVREENMLLLSPPVGHYRYTPGGGGALVASAD